MSENTVAQFIAACAIINWSESSENIRAENSLTL